ncbi:MAG: hypothetical protein A2700_03175 [Candidatus Blackburnbacteria bacterium RIFCSPHIGHO2_01_FULL_44_64]|uniref:Nudix hydrolase domain-containing protein n=1 Tax=Candidatus Blackburnbacteria bacterium RIFCSPHIGHO2_02_FULL_44_20 TaxID=1797516 RepID=A0A1G1V9Z2_9BACT|nr:MAG: hypothetical protein A2700_03175 [Candidatus Blackburnbacteria bacterium RIFCSPHIGHO2_01_FULL_44_64]OGY11511.1 MAG: hypothetical protein A3E16_02570 [Candidatus Blackburnbacteria bacterium RIFCSPHIGHO2_12_FULL_44_25]OGY12189.1 MAG: hypothetical protein A3D26_01230 [Candidatus Blackburnbacteria bacterium RIFCSPHIGHO2_02_FULL_44_20]OGY15246.1 MAG: hypothetical protein A3A62_01170 [Candidatus Blackburnbacteria bacterium RIFCSPLOWO2_01_FULL_44_43]OGY16711.1 MAG: hypothetical protein A3H88_0
MASIAEVNLLAPRERLPYRPGVIGIIVNDEGKFLVVQMVTYPKNGWRFPGGGVELRETPAQALLRELKEELGTDQFKIVGESRYLNVYDFPSPEIVQRYNKGGGRDPAYRGQIQSQFLVQFTGKLEDIRPNQSEIGKFKWVSREELPGHFIFPGQWEQARRVLDELLPDPEVST